MLSQAQQRLTLIDRQNFAWQIQSNWRCASHYYYYLNKEKVVLKLFINISPQIEKKGFQLNTQLVFYNLFLIFLNLTIKWLRWTQFLISWTMSDQEDLRCHEFLLVKMKGLDSEGHLKSWNSGPQFVLFWPTGCSMLFHRAVTAENHNYWLQYHLSYGAFRPLRKPLRLACHNFSK